VACGAMFVTCITFVVGKAEAASVLAVIASVCANNGDWWYQLLEI